MRIFGGRIVGDGGPTNTSNHGIGIGSSSDVRVDDVRIESMRCFGIIVGSGSDDVHVRGCTIRDTRKDGIHFNAGVHNFSAIGNTLINPGDDGIAVVSYLSQGDPCRDFTISLNRVTSTGARGISVVGGENGIVALNEIANTAAAGLMILADAVYETHGVSDVTIASNMVVDPSQSISNGGIHISSADSLYPIHRLTVEGNTVKGGSIHGIYVNGASAAMEDISICRNKIVNSGYAGIAVNHGNQITINGNAVASPGRQGIVIAAEVRGVLQLNDNRVSDTNAVNGSNNDSVEVNGAALTLVVCDGNVVTDTVGYTEYPFVFYACPVRYGDANTVSTVGVQREPAFASGAIAYRNPPLRAFASTVPATGSWSLGSTVYNSAPVAGGAPGWVCTTAGTFGTLTGVTADTTSGSPSVTLSSAENVRPGMYILIAGVTGAKLVRSVSGSTVVLTSNANATVSGAAVSYVAPVFKALANLAA